MDETVTITKKEYDELIENQTELLSLEAAGLDNWDGCSQAFDIREEWAKEDLREAEKEKT